MYYPFFLLKSHPILPVVRCVPGWDGSCRRGGLVGTRLMWVIPSSPGVRSHGRGHSQTVSGNGNVVQQLLRGPEPRELSVWGSEQHPGGSWTPPALKNNVTLLWEWILSEESTSLLWWVTDDADKGKAIAVVFLDFRKVFYAVVHDFLPSKLENIM